ncbi:hypothetical protein BaRGS_00035795 [Batillaria attramentaria]|uniref:Uncharacterized protein n=1 Tax=Batillaria attramentaria TaxID=370345 RepID=A0ABD0JEG3_9CAEN
MTRSGRAKEPGIPKAFEQAGVNRWRRRLTAGIGNTLATCYQQRRLELSSGAVEHCWYEGRLKTCHSLIAVFSKFSVTQGQSTRCSLPGICNSMATSVLTKAFADSAEVRRNGVQLINRSGFKQISISGYPAGRMWSSYHRNFIQCQHSQITAVRPELSGSAPHKPAGDFLPIMTPPTEQAETSSRRPVHQHGKDAADRLKWHRFSVTRRGLATLDTRLSEAAHRTIA